MAKKQEQIVNFNCAKCNHLNTPFLLLIVDKSSEGCSSQVLDCKKCGFKNIVNLDNGLLFPLNNTITRG